MPPPTAPSPVGRLPASPLAPSPSELIRVIEALARADAARDYAAALKLRDASNG